MIIKLVRHGSGKGHIIHHKRVGVLNTQNREAWYGEIIKMAESAKPINEEYTDAGHGGPLAVASGVVIMACFYAFRTPIRRQRDKEYRRPSNHAGKALKFQSFSGSKRVGWRAVGT